MAYKDVTPPAGAKITKAGANLNVPDNPIVPFIRGDGTGPDIWASAVRVFDGAQLSQGIADATASFSAFPTGFLGGVSLAGLVFSPGGGRLRAPAQAAAQVTRSR